MEQAFNCNPSVVECGLKLKTAKSHMDADKAIRIKYAAKYAQTANYWKYYIGKARPQAPRSPSPKAKTRSPLHPLGERNA